MSNPFKAVGKAFKSVVKVVKKVAVPALMIGAIVLTGGAAVGLLPSLGTMIGGLGLSAGVSTALAGAISSGAVGAVLGGVTGGMKGATKGFLMGAATGGVLGAAGAIGPNGIIGGGKALAGGISPSSMSSTISSNMAAIEKMGSGISNAAAAAPGGGIGGATAAATQAATTATASGATASTGGLGGLFGNNPSLAANLLGGLSSAFEPSASKEQRKILEAEAEERRRAGFFAYGGGDPDGSGKTYANVPGVYSGGISPLVPKPLAPPPSIRPENYYTPPTKRWVWNPTTSSVEEVAS